MALDLLIAQLLLIVLAVLLTLYFARKKYQTFQGNDPMVQAKREILEIIQNAKLTPKLNNHEKKLIEYVLRFKDRIAREVMVPRVDLFTLPVETSIREAAKLVFEEGFSRIPVYRQNVDNITGVLMYKDLLEKYREYEERGNDSAVLDAPIESIQKSILYTPETKKISNLLLDFRKKQVHLAIVVDEYGGTEGIVSIEDILEEIVGEIEDEYDVEEEELYQQESDGVWIVDARMSIIDLEQQLGVKIPSEGEYDTLGGYLFHSAGSIPAKGFFIDSENYHIEVLSSDERRVEKVRLKVLVREDEERQAGDEMGEESRK